jgi:predicted TIM-barrel fold metal-dependent hydrolase
MTRSDTRLVDCHVHMRGLNSIPNLTAIMDACGMSAINVASLSTRGDDNLAQNVVGLLFKMRQPGRVYSFGGLRHPESGAVSDPLSFVQQAERLIAAGCDGIKMIEGKPSEYKLVGKTLDSADYGPLYAWLQETGRPLLLHVGDPPRFWSPQVEEWVKQRGWSYGDGTFPALEELRAQVETVLDRFPRLNVIFAHFYFMSADLSRAGAFLDRHPGAHLDITPNGELYTDMSRNPGEAREFFIRFQQRILFGTDNAGGRRTPNPDRTAAAAEKVAAMRRFLETDDEFPYFGGTCRGLALPPEVCVAICAGNFERLAGARPADVNVGLAMAECERLIELARTAGDDPVLAGELPAIADEFE